MSAILDSPISSGTSLPETQILILTALFGANSSRDEYKSQSVQMRTYFSQWYDEQCKRSVRQVSTTTHRELLDVVTFLRDSQEAHSSIKEILHQRQSTTDFDCQRVGASVILAARLLSMLSIGEIVNCISPGRTVPWKNVSLCESIRSEFPASKLNATDKLPRIFKAMNLERIAGIKVRWTNNLADHLSLDGDEVRLFHHVSFLELHVESSSTLFPPGFLEETILTMALMIPSGDPKSEKWFGQQRRVQLDPRAKCCGHLSPADRRIDRFNYWRDRIFILKEAFDESEPRSVSHWWYDDRKKVQWWTFWIAGLILLLTVVFGLIQSVTGTVSAWAALQSLPHGG